MLKQPQPGSADYTYVTMTQVVMPNQTNTHGTAFGGEILSWVDICAGVSAGRHCRTNVVTASMDDVHFLTPIKLGYIVILESQVNAVFSSSMEVGVVVRAEDPLTGDRKVAVRAYSTFVSLNEGGHPQKCPPLKIENKEQEDREKKAHHRRKLRLLHRQSEIE